MEPQVIYKYAIPPGVFRSQFQVPFGARVLDVQCQHGHVTIWMLHRPPGPGVGSIFKTFRLVGTGGVELDGDWEYLATVQQPPYVWHVFEEKED